MALVDHPVGFGGPLTSHAANVHNPEYFDLGEYNFSVVRQLWSVNFVRDCCSVLVFFYEDAGCLFIGEA